MNEIIYGSNQVTGNVIACAPDLRASPRYHSAEPVHPLVAAARKYLGAPFKHRGRAAAGMDCAGLGHLAYADNGIILPDMSGYGREPHRDGLASMMVKALGEPIWQGRPGVTVDRALMQPGDVVLMRFVTEPHHVAIVTDSATHGLGLIHCYGNIGHVVEHGLDAMWQERILAVFRRPV